MCNHVLIVTHSYVGVIMNWVYIVRYVCIHVCNHVLGIYIVRYTCVCNHVLIVTHSYVGVIMYWVYIVRYVCIHVCNHVLIHIRTCSYVCVYSCIG